MSYLQRDNDIRYGMHRVKTSSFTMYFTMRRAEPWEHGYTDDIYECIRGNVPDVKFPEYGEPTHARV